MNQPIAMDIPACVECGAVSLPADETRWQLHRVHVDELAWYCPACAEREFDDGNQWVTGHSENGR